MKPSSICFAILTTLFFFTSIAYAESVTIWKFGEFDGSASELEDAESMPRIVDLTVGLDGVGTGLPEIHSPPDDDHNPDNGNVINISFSAEAGSYVLRVGQLFTYQPETVTLSLDGSSFGNYTTTLRDTVHEIPLVIGSAGSHTLTFEEFYGNNGYRFDAVELSMEVDDLTAIPADVHLLATNDIGMFSLYGGIGEYSARSDDSSIADVELSSDGKRAYVRANNTGQATITIQDQAANYAIVNIIVGENIVSPTLSTTYNPSTGEVTMPSVQVIGDQSGTTYTVTGELTSLEAYLLTLNYYGMPTDVEEILMIVVTGVHPK